MDEVVTKIEEKVERQDLPDEAPENQNLDQNVGEENTQQTFTDEEKEIISLYGFDVASITQDELKKLAPNLKKVAAEYKRMGSQNKQVSEQYQKLKEELESLKSRDIERQKLEHERFQGMSEAERMRLYLKSQGADLSKPLLQDEEYLESLYWANKSTVDAMFPAPKLEQSNEQPKQAGREITFTPEHTAVLEKVYTDAIASGKTEAEAEQIAISEWGKLMEADIAKAGHADYRQIVSTPEFKEWFDRQSKWDKAKFISTDPADHISLISNYKAYQIASQAAKAEEVQRRRQMEAGAGLGHINGGGPGSSNDADDDNLPMSEWVKRRNAAISKRGG